MSTGLPSGLWDLTISRLCSRASGIRMGRLGFAHSAINNAQAALAKSSTAVSFPPGVSSKVGRSKRTPKRPGPLTPRAGRPLSGPVAEIERRVQKLKEAADAEVLAGEKLVFSETDLLSMYEDLLAHPEETSVVVDQPPSNTEADMAIVRHLELQLLHVNVVHTDTPLVAKLREESGQSSQRREAPVIDQTLPLHRRVIQLANARLERLDVLERLQPSSSTADPTPLPIALFSMEEYQTLTRTCVNEADFDAAESVLYLMKRSGLAIPEESLNAVLHQYTAVGNVQGLEHCLTTFLTAPPTESQRHLHVKCHLRATPRGRIAESALAVLHSYESQGVPAPMKTYSTSISSLYSTGLAVARAQAWDLFSHMRYVAHPTPDVILYTSMIRACASPISSSRRSDPERALDLWTEMTVEHRLKPTVGSYNAVILACARSGRKSYVNEAFRIAKQMLDSHRDAYGRSAYLPDRGTLCALLEGAKRVGDLARARWILADLVQSEASEEEGVNEEIMMHVFHTYTSYFPPFTRNLAKLVPGQEPTASSSPTSDTEVSASEQPKNVPVDLSPRFTRIPPQTRNEVIDEVQLLFQRILEDTGKAPGGSTLDEVFTAQKKFQHVKLTVRLVNSYISVHYQHSSLEAAELLFWKVFSDVGVVPDTRTYVEALERCGRSKRGLERPIGFRFAEKIWSEWMTLENSKISSPHPVDPRMVERAHVAFIRILILNGQVERALDHVKTFVARYPPSGLYECSRKSPFRSTKTVLVGARPLVRLSSPNEVPDDGVPPLLMFNDLELLHHRLVAASMGPEIAYIKYISKAYEWALRGRRDAAMRARPAPNTYAITAS
ncbi:hypothetical protein C8R43DRAFT_919339 [Mycena crocata]|nr:hypothetical protein C8R43DRAFT_919339 [Mycena crocata]